MSLQDSQGQILDLTFKYFFLIVPTSLASGLALNQKLEEVREVDARTTGRSSFAPSLPRLSQAPEL